MLPKLRPADSAACVPLLQSNYKRANITSNTYGEWVFNYIFALYLLPDIVGEFLATLKTYPRARRSEALPSAAPWNRSRLWPENGFWAAMKTIAFGSQANASTG